MSKKRKSDPLVRVINLKTGKLSKKRIAFEDIHALKRVRSQLSRTQTVRIIRIYSITGLLLGNTLDDWVKGFTYDLHPEREIQVWEQIAYALRKYTDQHNLVFNKQRDILFKLLDLANGIEPQNSLSKELFLLLKEIKKENIELEDTASSNSTPEETSASKEVDVKPWDRIDYVKLAFAYQESTKALELELEERDDVLVRLVRLMEGEKPQDILSKKLQHILTKNKDSKERVVSLVVRRKGQSKFRQALIEAYQGACTVTRCNEESALEAAHIIRYSDAGTNHPSNGMLLRADIHMLFDKNLLSVNPQNYEVIVSPKLFGTSYGELNGRRIKLPKEDGAKPNLEALSKHYQRFLQNCREKPNKQQAIE